MNFKKIFMLVAFLLGGFITYSYMMEQSVRTFNDTDVFKELMNAIRSKDTKQAAKMLKNVCWIPDVNQRSEGHTPLHDAVLTNNLELVKLLVEKGADWKAKTAKSQMNALDIAIDHKYNDIADYLKSKGVTKIGAIQEIKQPKIEIMASDMVSSLAEKFKQVLTSEKDISTGITKMLTKLCKEVDEPYMRKFLEKLPHIVDKLCEYSKLKGFKEKTDAAALYKEDLKIENLLEDAVNVQDDLIGFEKIARTLSPIIAVGIGENTNNIFEWRFDPILGAYPDTVFIDLTAHKGKVSVESKYKNTVAKYNAVLDKKDPNLVRELAQKYKIHLMPKEGSEERVFIELATLIQADKGLQERIPVFKIKISPYEQLINGKIPKIVIYVDSGKINAQYVLDKIYEHFKNYRGYTKYAPRYNQRVTDFLYFAQGDGDDKPLFPQLFEEGQDYPYYTGKIYFKSDFTPEGAAGGYYLTLPTQKK